MRNLLICAALLFTSCDDHPNTSAKPQLPAERLLTPRGSPTLFRAEIPNGWLVWNYEGGMVIVNDPEHKWSLK
jgi:hypothetical protein